MAIFLVKLTSVVLELERSRWATAKGPEGGDVVGIQPGDVSREVAKTKEAPEYASKRQNEGRCLRATGAG